MKTNPNSVPPPPSIGRSAVPQLCPQALASSGPLLSVKELAFELKRHSSYVYAMRQAGFPMIEKRTTLAAALDWLAKNPDWRKKL